MTKVVSLVKKDEEEFSHLVVDIHVRGIETKQRLDCEFFGTDENIPGFMIFMPRDELGKQTIINCDDIVSMQALPVMKKLVKRKDSKDD